jgi:hypothetical protein
MCNYAPTATNAQEQCVQVESALLGYNWSTQPICAAADTVPGCNACTSALGMSDAHCAQIYATCF